MWQLGDSGQWEAAQLTCSHSVTNFVNTVLVIIYYTHKSIEIEGGTVLFQMRVASWCTAYQGGTEHLCLFPS